LRLLTPINNTAKNTCQIRFLKQGT
jgi:hypothetical protein